MLIFKILDKYKVSHKIPLTIIKVLNDREKNHKFKFGFSGEGLLCFYPTSSLFLYKLLLKLLLRRNRNRQHPPQFPTFHVRFLVVEDCSSHASFLLCLRSLPFHAVAGATVVLYVRRHTGNSFRFREGPTGYHPVCLTTI